MKAQNYKNHIRWYIPHHLIFLPLLFSLLTIGIYKAFIVHHHELIWILFGVVIFCLIYLTLMLRQHYALVLQNRIVELEFQLRYFELYQKRSSTIISQLTFDQIAALRFADDEEFKLLLEKALKEKLGGDEIKKLIKDWQPDEKRV